MLQTETLPLVCEGGREGVYSVWLGPLQGDVGGSVGQCLSLSSESTIPDMCNLVFFLPAPCD